MQHGDAVAELHHHLHVVLDDQDGQILRRCGARAPWSRRFRPRSCPRSARRGSSSLRFGGERDADLKVALFAVRQIGGEFVGLAQQADRIERGFRLLVDVGEARYGARSMFQPCRRDCAAMRTFSSAEALGRMLVI